MATLLSTDPYITTIISGTHTAKITGTNSNGATIITTATISVDAVTGSVTVLEGPFTNTLTTITVSDISFVDANEVTLDITDCTLYVQLEGGDLQEVTDSITLTVDEAGTYAVYLYAKDADDNTVCSDVVSITLVSGDIGKISGPFTNEIEKIAVTGILFVDSNGDDFTGPIATYYVQIDDNDAVEVGTTSGESYVTEVDDAGTYSVTVYGTDEDGTVIASTTVSATLVEGEDYTIAGSFTNEITTTYIHDIIFVDADGTELDTTDFIFTATINDTEVSLPYTSTDFAAGEYEVTISATDSESTYTYTGIATLTVVEGQWNELTGEVTNTVTYITVSGITFTNADGTTLDTSDATLYIEIDPEE